MMTALAALAAAAALAAEPEPSLSYSRRFEQLLPGLRAGSAELDVRPGRWETRFTLPAVEAYLSDPVKFPDAADAWGRELAAAEGASGLAALAAKLLEMPTEPPRPSTGAAPASGADLPSELAESIELLAAGIARARPFLALANSGLSAEERRRLAAVFQAALKEGPPERQSPADYDLASRFDLAALLQASRWVLEAADAAAARLPEARARQLPRRLVVGGSTVALGGTGDDVYGPEELASSIVIDLGGSNRYLAPPTAAGDGEIKVVIDLGRELVIESTGPVASGVFGIGALYLPSPKGPKALTAGNFSLGAGLFGSGVLVVRGGGSALKGGDFSQGAAGFGLGLLDVEGDGPSLTAPLSAQGFGFTRGAGLMRVRGKKAKLECGLVYPDPRDAVAAVSLCQGVGYGPRAFAAGGFGLARVESEGASVESNYFAQGSGYWHAFGGFWLEGKGARVQSRRYGQGAGVHTALGAMQLKGDEHRVLHWGVGPAYGWDWGVGFASIEGDRGHVYADWGTGRGDVNGHAFAYLKGDGARLQLPEFGSGALKRTAPSYGAAVVSGRDVRMRFTQFSSATVLGPELRFSPWGVLVSEGEVRAENQLAVDAPVWRPLDREREEAARRDWERNVAELRNADAKPEAQRPAAWLFVASHGGLDGKTPRDALERLLSLSDAQAAALPRLFEPERFDEYIFLRVLAPAYGRRLAPAVLRELAQASGLRKQQMLGFLRSLPPAEGFPAVLDALRDRDWRVRREAAGALALWFDRQRGEEPGRIPYLEEVLSLCRRPDPAAKVADDQLARIAWKRLSDLLAALALDPASGFEERIALLRKAPNPFDPVSADTHHEFARIAGSRPKACVAAVEKELKDSAKLEAKAREKLLAIVEEGDPLMLPPALAGLGHIGRAQDAERIAGFLAHDSGFVREAAAAALGRMGKNGERGVQWALSSSSAALRQLGLLAAAQSSEPEVFRLVERGFSDREERVRLDAVAALAAAQNPLHRLRRELVVRLEQLALSDESPSVRASAAYAAGAYR